VLVLLAHGDRGGERRNGTLTALSRRLRALLPDLEVRAGAFNGEPGIDEAMRRLPPRGAVHVYPLFMSEGYFTRSAIPDALEGHVDPGEGRVIVHPPLGVASGLTDIVSSRARQGARRLGVADGAATILLAGHGSVKGDAARLAIEEQRRRLEAKGAFAAVRAAYLEEAPYIDPTLETLRDPLVVVGMFAGDGLHAAEDVPESIARLAPRRIVYTGAIANDPAIADLIARSVRERSGFVGRPARASSPAPAYLPG
jgi:sirohydrochlorin cobaltochelatase